ncbi:MAG TPA: glycosyltransferase [Nitrospirae bacterium]|nr:glycosyltransferase [Nitrospirota bacterium]
MNILFLSTENPYPPVGGHHIRTYNVLKILAQKHKIYFVGFAQTKAELIYIENLRELCETVDIFLIPKTGFNLQFLSQVSKNLFSRLPLTAQRFLVVDAKEKIKELLSRNRINLVHIDMLALAEYVECTNNIPATLTNHNVEFLRLYRWMKMEGSLLKKTYLFYQYLKLKSFEKKMCPLFEHCIVVSEDDRQHLQGLCDIDNFIIIPNGVDICYFKPSSEKVRKNHLVWVGGMAGPYNSDAVDFFLDRVWPVVRDEIPEVTIDFIGKKPTQKLQKKASVDHNIKILGFIDDVRPLVQSASVFVAPIRSGSGTKIKVLNAMAQAKAVVATTVAAEGIEVVDGEDILLADDPTEFARKIIYLLRNRELAMTIGQKARSLIENKYSWEVIAEKIFDTYQVYQRN